MNKKNPEVEILKNISAFKHIYNNIVKFDEVDSVGVVHNIKYLYWLEWARTQYLENLGIKLNPVTFISELPLMVVHNDIDYYNPAKFSDKYKVLTRISFIKKSSLGFENLVLLEDNTLLSKANAIMVYFDYKQKIPTRIPDELRNLIKLFENGNVNIID